MGSGLLARSLRVSGINLSALFLSSKKTTVYTKKNGQGLASEGPVTSPV